MKAKIIILILSIGISINLHGQCPTLKAMFFNPNVYRTKIDLVATRLTDKNFDTIYRNDTVIIKVSELGHLDYKIISEDENGFAIIRILPCAKLVSEPLQTNPNKNIKVVRFTNECPTDSTNAYNYYFAIKKDAFKPLSKTLLSTKIVGVPLVQPIKLRPSKGTEGWNLGGEFTLSYNFGIRFKLCKNPFTQNYLTVIPYGFGVGAAKYFTETSDGKLTDKKDAFAVTYYQGGLLWTYQKINVGVFVGFDAMISKQNNWFYQGTPWLSFGLGYKFKND